MSIADELVLLSNTKETMRIMLGLDESVPFSQYIPFTPKGLFLRGEQGAWYDPSDLSTLFQDATGTIPVAADGDPVGLMMDKSGNGFHATQTDSGSRPLYKTDGSVHWLEFDGVSGYMTAGSAGDWNYLHNGTGATVGYGASFGLSPNPDEAGTVFATFNLDDSQVGFASFFYDRSLQDSAPAQVPLVVRDDIGGGKLIKSINTVMRGSVNLSRSNKGSSQLGLHIGGTTGGFKLYGASLVNKLLTSVEVSALDAFLAEKTGTTLL